MDFHVRVCAFTFALVFVCGSAVADINWNDPASVATAAAASSPSLRRVEAEVRAARERTASAGSLPNPMLMTGIQDKQVDFRDDEMMTMYMVGASQTFTRSSKREALRRTASLRADAAEKELASLRAEIERDALLAWYEIAAVDRQVAALEEIARLSESMIDAARARYEVGTALQADIIRAQLQQSSIERERLRLRGAREVAVARLLPMLSGGPSEVPPLALSDETERRSTVGGPVPSDDHPAFVALRTEAAALEQEVRFARLLAKPDVDIEMSYGMRREETDMFSLTARVELPLRKSQKVDPRVREVVAQREAVLERLDELRRQIAQSMGEALAEHRQASDELRLIDEVLLPQTRLSIDSTLAAYQVGRTSFETLLSTQNAYLSLQRERAEVLRRHVAAVIEFEALQRGARSRGVSKGTSSALQSPSREQSAQMGGM